MADLLRDGQVRQIFNKKTELRYKVTIPGGWVQANQNKLSDEWVWGDNYTGTPPDLPELPDEIKTQFRLVALPPLQPNVEPNPGQVRDRPDGVFQGNEDGRRVRPMGGKSKKRPTRRRLSSKARKARKSRKVSKVRTTRRR